MSVSVSVSVSVPVPVSVYMGVSGRQDEKMRELMFENLLILILVFRERDVSTSPEARRAGQERGSAEHRPTRTGT